MTIGERVKKLREEKKFTLRKLAQKTGMTWGHIWQIENNRVQNPGMETISKLALSLNTTATYLYHGDQTINLKDFDTLPEGLEEFIIKDKERCGLQSEDVLDLLGMKYRGSYPKTSEGWAYVYSSIKLIVEKGL